MIKIDKKKCIRCGACAALAPKHFELDANGEPRTKPNCELDKDCKLAIETCPVGAITDI